jgi:hypothetical protein
MVHPGERGIHHSLQGGARRSDERLQPGAPPSWSGATPRFPHSVASAALVWEEARRYLGPDGWPGRVAYARA